MIAIFSPSSALRRVDLPTLGLPMIEMKPDLNRFSSLMDARIPEISFPRNRKAGGSSMEQRATDVILIILCRLAKERSYYNSLTL